MHQQWSVICRLLSVVFMICKDTIFFCARTYFKSEVFL